MFPVVGVCVVTVMKVGPLALKKLKGAPQGSDPVIAWSAVMDEATIMFAGWARTGVWLTATIWMVKLFVSLAPKAVAVTDAGKLPAVPDGGVLRWIFPVRVVPTCVFEVSVIQDGPDDVNVIASPSGSLARIAWSAVAGAH